ncbi:MAG: histidine kinase dimerization/phosphoacceptor domain -containing protein [Spirochaetota bacterium]
MHNFDMEEVNAILQAAPIGMLVFDENERVLLSNSYAKEMFENKQVEVRGMRCGDFLKCENRHRDPNGCGESEKCPDCAIDQAIKAVVQRSRESEHEEGEALILTETSTRPEYYSYKVNSLILNGQRCAVLALYNVTAQREAAEEKNRLLIEMNHRIKNNLSLISSLIALKQDEVGTDTDLSDIRTQVNTIMLIHEKLYNSAEIRHIHLASYIDDLLQSIISFFPETPIILETSIEDVTLPTKAVVSIGLILNELATNAIKHAFPGADSPRFRVELRIQDETEELVLKVVNNGSKFPEGVDFETTRTLGLRLISSLVRQIDGTLQLQREPETEFTIRLPARTP